MLQLGRPFMVCVVARSRQTTKKKTKNKNTKEKEKLIVMSCTWKIRLGLNKNQEKNVEKMMKKLQKHKSFLLLQGFTL